jgi:hypothetical protein
MRLRSADDSVATEEGQQVGLSVSSTPRVGRETGSWALALIVLVASVMIPLGKLVALAYLLITAQFTRRDPRPDPPVRLVQLIGRWLRTDRDGLPQATLVPRRRARISVLWIIPSSTRW